jgi:RNA polymerase sigma-B factor
MAAPDKTIEWVLLRRYRDQGDLDARAELIERYMPLARSVALAYLHRGEQFDDLVQIAAVGLIRAIDRFDPGREVPFASYAVPTIHGEIKRHFRDHASTIRVPRSVQELNLRLNRLIAQLSPQLERTPTISELAKAADADEEDVVEALASRRAHYSLSWPASHEDGLQLDPLETLGDVDPHYALCEDRALLKPALRLLDDRERTILHLRFVQGLTQEEIAQRLSLSQMHISRLIRKALEKIRIAIAS